MYLTKNVQSQSIEQNKQTLHEQYNAIQAECRLLRQHYQTLYEQHQALFERCSSWQSPSASTTASRQTMRDFCQSLQEQRREIQLFRDTLHTHLIHTRSYRRSVSSLTQAPRSLIRKTILLGVGNEEGAAVLKEGMLQATAHRVFMAADSSQVLSLLQNVHIDVLILDDELTPLSAIKLYHHLHGIQGRERLPVIIMSTCCTSLLPEELMHPNLIGLEKPITGEALVKVIDQLLV
ncbi:MAG TPA: hypothetical protein VE843_10315 [Ktedonobacteraceae bacterium]|nr:hypothetical protein [Ktedonobacteraceae bacterium]